MAQERTEAGRARHLRGQGRGVSGDTAAHTSGLRTLPGRRDHRPDPDGSVDDCSRADLSSHLDRGVVADSEGHSARSRHVAAHRGSGADTGAQGPPSAAVRPRSRVDPPSAERRRLGSSPQSAPVSGSLRSAVRSLAAAGVAAVAGRSRADADIRRSAREVRPHTPVHPHR